MRKQSLFRISRFLLVAAALTACTRQPGAVVSAPGEYEARGTEHDRACMRFTVRVAGPYHQELAGPVEHPLLDVMPKEARRTARAAGLEPLVLAILQAERAEGPEGSGFLRQAALRQELFMRLVSLGTQLESVLSEIECTDDVVEELAAQLDARERKRELKLTLASIVVGAAAATLGGAWEITNDESHGGPITGVVGGVASAGLGLLALMPREHSLRYTHAHNLLTPIQQGEDPARAYPTFVRRLLQAPGPNGESAPGVELRADFERKIEAAYATEKGRADARSILFGAGGVYDQRLIGLRETLYDTLEAKLNTFARELELLTRYLVNLSDAPSSVAEQLPENEPDTDSAQ